jgi:hypothetical protein
MKACGARALDLDYGITQVESLTFGSVFQRLCGGPIVNLSYPAAFAADEELHRVLVAGLGTRNERVQALNLMDQPLFHQEVESAIDRRRHSTFVGLLESVEELISGQGTIGI